MLTPPETAAPACDRGHQDDAKQIECSTATAPTQARLRTSDRRLAECSNPTEHGNQWHCCHSVFRLRFVTRSNESRHLVWACQQCGRYSDEVQQETVEPSVLAVLAEAELVFGESFVEVKRYSPEGIEHLYAIAQSDPFTRSKSRQKRYAKFLQTPTWYRLRDKRLHLDGHVCADCGGTATMVHHVWYPQEELWAETPLWCLVSLCADCHEKAHRIFRRGGVPWNSA